MLKALSSIATLTSTTQATSGWNNDQAFISLTLSNVAYCGQAQYLDHVYSGVVAGFVPTKVIFEEKHDVNGFVGYLPSDKSIYVAFRGSETVDNWLTDFNVDKDKYTVWPECKCKIHSGFQNTTQSVNADVLAEVSRLHTLYPNYQIKTTGHSLGGAMAQLTAMMLLKNGFQVSMINFGQPRIGDQDYADFSSSVFPNQWRVVHNQDIVPHTPNEGIPEWYRHSSTEMYEDETGIRQCDSSGEDPTCSDKWHSWQLGASDHLLYLGQCVGSDCGQCSPGVVEPSGAFLQ